MPGSAPIRLRFETFAAFVEKHASYLSLRGMFLASDDPAPAGSAVDFAVELEDGFSLFKGTGEVLWVRPEADSDGPAGMGLRFTSLDDKGRDLLLKVLEEQVKSGGDPYDADEVPAGTVSSPQPPEPAEEDLSGSFSAPWGEHLPELPSEVLDDSAIGASVRDERPAMKEPLAGVGAAAAERDEEEDEDDAVSFELDADEEPTLISSTEREPQQLELGGGPDLADDRPEPPPAPELADEEEGGESMEISEGSPAADSGGWTTTEPLDDDEAAPAWEPFDLRAAGEGSEDEQVDPLGGDGASTTQSAADAADAANAADAWAAPVEPAFDAQEVGLEEESVDEVGAEPPAADSFADGETPTDDFLPDEDWHEEVLEPEQGRWAAVVGRSRSQLLIAALLLVAIVAAYIYRHPLSTALGLGSTAAQASSSSPPTQAPPDLPTDASTVAGRSNAPGAAETSQDEPTDPRTAATIPASEPPSSASPVSEDLQASEPAAPVTEARRIAELTWRSSDDATVVTVRFDGSFAERRLRRFRLERPPRELLRLAGLGEPYSANSVEVATDQLQRIRAGFHPAPSGDELHLVFDLVSSSVSVDVRHLVDRLELTIR